MIERDPRSRDRRDDSNLARFVLPVVLSALTSVLGGAVGSYMTLQIAVYRISLIEAHEADDRQRFSADDMRDHAQDLKNVEQDVRIGVIEQHRTGGM